MFRIVDAEPLEGYRLRLKFEDGIEGIVDLSRYVGRGVFAVWPDEANFRRVRVEQGELLWKGGVDLSADALYIEITGKRPEDLFPSLHRTSAHA